MTKFGEKLRDAFTPGHHKHEHEHEREHVHTTSTEPGMTTTAAAPGTYGTYETGAGYGAGTGTAGEAGYGTAATTTTTTVQEGGAPVMAGNTKSVGTEAPNCEPQYFTRVEDRPQVVERKEYIKEHVPIEQEYKVETYATGKEREAAEGRYAENLGAEERIVAEAKPKATCK